MALTNFSLPFGALTQQVPTWGATLPPLHPAHQLAANTNNLLYSPADHQQQQGDEAAPPPESDFYKNNPYAPPQLHQQQQQQQQQPIRHSYQYNSNNNNNHNLQNNNRLKNGNTYLPPIPPPGARNTQFNNQKPQQQQQQQPAQKQQQHYSHFSISQQQQQQQHHQLHQQQQIKGNNGAFKAATSVSTVASAAATASAATTSTRTYGEGSYNNFGAAAQQQQRQQQKQFYNSYSHSTSSFVAQSQQKTQTQTSQQSFANTPVTEAPQPAAVYGAVPAPTLRTVDETNGGGNDSDAGGDNGAGGNEPYPHRPPGFTRVQAGQGTRTQVHAVLDYDVEEGEEEEYYDEDSNKKSPMPTVTPIQGPIFLKNGTAPVVPLFSYPTLNNGSFVQIPIWWTALSVALGLDVRGDIIKGVPCIKRYHQLFCPTAGNSYPIDKIERFIDDNKALMRRMYGDFEMNLEPGGPQSQTKKRKRRFIDDPDIFIPPGAFPAVVPDDEGSTEPHAEEAGESYFGKLRNKRQANRNANKPNTNSFANAGQNTGRVDACESKVEIVTPYWASNSAGKIRAIVNTQHFEQAIHQEVCT
ncbi:protein spaetzle 3 isoform X2 [Zeugodacus cucurbitae]|nr:protein spaetzle 3 isoform X2 [Zeugodacus cucurbitae]